VVTWVTPYGEGLPSAESSLAVSAGYLLTVAPPSESDSAIPFLGWNLYVGTASGGPYQKQNSQTLEFGTNWNEAATGLVSGANPPSSWGATLNFLYPERNVTGFSLQWYGHDELSGGGLEQSVTQFVDDQTAFDMPVVILGTDLSAWYLFLKSYGLPRVPFDLTLADGNPGTGTYVLTSNAIKADWKAVNVYGFTLELRKVITTVSPVSAITPPPATSFTTVSVTSPAAGNFTVAHSLGRNPVGASNLETSGGDIWFQKALLWDAVNIYLVASDAGVTAKIILW
jgi:hypothetical protein